MDKVTVTIITFNEEDKIKRCLESVRWADEIIVVDSHSTDNTVAICKTYTDRVIDRDWPGYIEQKNFAIEQATYDELGMQVVCDNKDTSNYLACEFWLPKPAISNS